MMASNTDLRESYNELTAQNDDKLKRTFEHYFRGFITLDELTWNIQQVFDSYYLFLVTKSVRTKITAENWDAFLSDYEAWNADSLIKDDSKILWLKYSSVSRDVEQIASVDEKSLFFEIMDRFGFTVEYYEPLPVGAAIPDMRIATYGDGRIWDIVNDGGLATDQRPVGKTFELTDKYGLKTTLQILRQGDNGRGKKCDFWGMGTIEGYTSDDPVEISVELENGKVHYLSVLIKHSKHSEHYKVFATFPLWQDYLANVNKKHEIYKTCVEAFKDSVMKAYQNNGESC